MTASINIVKEYYVSYDLAAECTTFLFSSTLARRLPNLTLKNYHLPYYLVPKIPNNGLQGWLQNAQETIPLSDLEHEPGAEYILRRGQETVPYFYQSTGVHCPRTLGDTVQATKLSKRLDMSQPPNTDRGFDKDITDP